MWLVNAALRGKGSVSILRGVSDTLVLTPRGMNLLVGYSILNAGQPTVFVRCPPG